MDLWPALVLSTTEDACTVLAGGRREVVAYASFFPGDRRGRVSPGHLVAVESATEEVVWRWFDAVVIDTAAGTVTLWEPGHGTVTATPRDPSTVYPPGSRAYLSAGLPGPASPQGGRLPVRVGYVPVIGAAPLFVMTGAGWSREAGLDLALTKFESGPPAIQALASGDISIGTLGDNTAAATPRRDTDAYPWALTSTR